MPIGHRLPATPVPLLAGNPARTFGIDHRKGAIAPGLDADLVVIDPEPRWTLRQEDLLSRYPLSPYVGAEFQGVIEETYVRGVPVYQDGKIVSQPGHGKLLRRGA